MVKAGLKVGSVFEDGGLYYEVQAVLPNGNYISKRVEPEAKKEETPVEVTRKRRVKQEK